MRYLATCLLALASAGFMSAPILAEEPQRPVMSEDGRRMFADVKRVYLKYYELVLDHTKAGEPYKAEDVWDLAVKEARNAEYRDRNAFNDAVARMKAVDRIFRREVNDLATQHAREFAEAVRKWREDQG